MRRSRCTSGSSFPEHVTGRQRFQPARWSVWLDHLGRDLRSALRMMRRNPGFSAVAVLSLGIGIGASTAVFSVVDAMMFRRLPVADAGALVSIREYISTQTRKVDLFPTVEYERFRDLTPYFSDVVAVAMLDRSNITIGGSGGGLDPGRVRVALVSGRYFHMYGVGAERGRVLGPDDDRVPSAHPVMVVSHDYWLRRLGGASDVVGHILSLSGTSYTIVGVVGSSFTGDWPGRPVDIWVPTMMQAEVMVDAPGYLRDRGVWPSSWVRVVARLRPRVLAGQALAAASLVHAQMVKGWEGADADARQLEFDAGRRLLMESAARGYSPQREALGRSLLILAFLVALVLLIACANVAGLLLARAAAREREMALRLAIGAGTSRLARQLFTESLVLACAGGVLGLLLSAWGSNALAAQATMGPVKMDWGSSSWTSFSVGLDARAVAFAVVLCLGTTTLFGLAPVFRMSRVALTNALTSRADASGGGALRRFRLGRALVVAQVALSLVLLVGAGLFMRTLKNLRSQDMGFERHHVLLGWTQAGATGRTRRALRDLYHVTQQRLSQIPGVVATGVSNHGSLDGSDAIGFAWNNVQVAGRPPETRRLAGWRTFVTPGYFAAMGIPVTSGRDFTEFDTDSAPRVVIINETFAKFYFGNVDPVGHYIRMGWEGDSLSLVVGVVGEYINGNPRERAKHLGFGYLPYRDRESGLRLSAMSVAVRVSGDPRAIASRVRDELRAIDPNLPVLKIDSIDEQLDDVLAQDRLMAGLASFFGAVALFLACLGLYGVVAYTTERRTSEIGIRMALGATGSAVLRMVLGEGFRLTFLGLAIGLPATFAATRVIASRLYGVSGSDPATVGSAALAMLGAAALAGYLPARRAAGVDPMVALRAD
jgi:predicted permease